MIQGKHLLLDTAMLSQLSFWQQDVRRWLPWKFVGIKTMQRARAAGDHCLDCTGVIHV